ncbi:MAG: DUF4878 domain-containing protein [Chitinophagaceae bacterium]
MKKLLFASLFAGLFALVITGCKGKDAAAGGDPKTVTLAFFERMSKKDVDGAAKLCTKDSKATLDLIRKGMEMSDKLKENKAKEDDGSEGFKDVEVGEAKINGDDATVAVTNKKKGETVEFPLKKEGGDWKVDFTMSTLMKMGMDASKKNGEDLFKDMNSGDTTLKNMKDLFNTDTLKEKLKEAGGLLDTLNEGLKKLNELPAGNN